MSELQDIATALKTLTDDIDGWQVYDYLTDAPNLPALIWYPQSKPIATPNEVPFVGWFLIAPTENAGAQAQMYDCHDAVVTRLLADQSLGGLVGSAMPLEFQPAIASLQAQEGRPRLLQSELIVNVFRFL